MELDENITVQIYEIPLGYLLYLIKLFLSGYTVIFGNTWQQIFGGFLVDFHMRNWNNAQYYSLERKICSDAWLKWKYIKRKSTWTFQNQRGIQNFLILFWGVKWYILLSLHVKENPFSSLFKIQTVWLRFSDSLRCSFE